MVSSDRRSPWPGRVVYLVPGLGVLALLVVGQGRAKSPHADPTTEYASAVQPFVKKYCLACHSTKVKRSGLDLERFASLDQVRKDLEAYLKKAAEEAPFPTKDRPLDLKNLRVVAFVQNDATQEVLQAVQAEVAE